MYQKSDFKRTKIGWIIAVLALLSALNSTFFFLCVMKSGLTGWLMVNSCAPGILVFFIGFFLKNPAVMFAATAWMIRYGTAGCLSSAGADPILQLRSAIS